MSNSTFQPDDTVLQKEEFSYGFILEVLTRGLYPNSMAVGAGRLHNAVLYFHPLERMDSDSPNVGNFALVSCPAGGIFHSPLPISAVLLSDSRLTKKQPSFGKSLGNISC